MVIFLNFLVLDGNSILNRSYYGIRVLSNKNGQTTNAIYGFLITMQKLLSEVRPDAVAVAFDLPVPTFRHSQQSQCIFHLHCIWLWQFSNLLAV